METFLRDYAQVAEGDGDDAKAELKEKITSLEQKIEHLNNVAKDLEDEANRKESEMKKIRNQYQSEMPEVVDEDDGEEEEEDRKGDEGKNSKADGNRNSAPPNAATSSSETKPNDNQAGAESAVAVTPCVPVLLAGLPSKSRSSRRF